MKAVLVHRPGGPEALDYTDAPTPAPGQREVLIRARAFGVGQPDKLIRSGVYKWMPPLPANPGNDVAGYFSRDEPNFGHEPAGQPTGAGHAVAEPVGQSRLGTPE